MTCEFKGYVTILDIDECQVAGATLSGDPNKGFRFDQPGGGYRVSDSSRTRGCTFVDGNVNNDLQYFPNAQGDCSTANFHCVCGVLTPSPAPVDAPPVAPHPTCVTAAEDYDDGGDVTSSDTTLPTSQTSASSTSSPHQAPTTSSSNKDSSSSSSSSSNTVGASSDEPGPPGGATLPPSVLAPPPASQFPTTILGNVTYDQAQSKTMETGAIVGASLGGIAALILLAVATVAVVASCKAAPDDKTMVISSKVGVVSAPLPAVPTAGFTAGSRPRIVSNNSYEGPAPENYTYIDDSDFNPAINALSNPSSAAGADVNRRSSVDAEAIFHSTQSYGSVISMNSLMGQHQHQQQAMLPVGVGAPEYTYIDVAGDPSDQPRTSPHFYPSTSPMSGDSAPFVLPPASPSYTTTPHGRQLATVPGQAKVQAQQQQLYQQQQQQLLTGAVYAEEVNRRVSVNDLYADQYAVGAGDAAAAERTRRASAASYADVGSPGRQASAASYVAMSSPAAAAYEYAAVDSLAGVRRGTLMPEQTYGDNGMPHPAGAPPPASPTYLAPVASMSPPMSPAYDMPLGYTADGTKDGNAIF